MKFVAMTISALVVGMLAVGFARSSNGFGGNAWNELQHLVAKSETLEVVRDGEYTGKNEVAAYIRKFDGNLPKNYITKSQARALGWRGGPLEPYAPGKSIGGDRFGNYEHRLPAGSYKECDIDTKGRPRGAKRLIYTPNGQRIYYTHDHYNTFEEVKEDQK